MQKRFSSLKGRLSDLPNFKCNKKGLQPSERNDPNKIKLGIVEYEILNHFCCLERVLVAEQKQAAQSESEQDGRNLRSC